MNCPHCGAAVSASFVSRTDGLQRVRFCTNCGELFQTVEVLKQERDLLEVRQTTAEFMRWLWTEGVRA